MRISGDFFLEPDDALARIDAAVTGLPVTAATAAITVGIEAAPGGEALRPDSPPRPGGRGPPRPGGASGTDWSLHLRAWRRSRSRGVPPRCVQWGFRSAAKSLNPLRTADRLARRRALDTLIDCLRRRPAEAGAVTGGELRAATELARAKFTASEWTARVP